MRLETAIGGAREAVDAYAWLSRSVQAIAAAAINMQAKQMPPRLIPNNLAVLRSSMIPLLFERSAEEAIRSGV
jgi:hypothetical protein